MTSCHSIDGLVISVRGDGWGRTLDISDNKLTRHHYKIPPHWNTVYSWATRWNQHLTQRYTFTCYVTAYPHICGLSCCWRNRLLFITYHFLGVSVSFPQWPCHTVCSQGQLSGRPYLQVPCLSFLTGADLAKGHSRTAPTSPSLPQ